MDEDGEIRDKFSHISSGMNEAAEKSNERTIGWRVSYPPK